MSTYFGWLKHANTKHLLQKIQQITGLKYSNFKGRKSIISVFYNKNIRIINISKAPKHFKIEFIYKNIPYEVKSRDMKLLNNLSKLKLPCNYYLFKKRKLWQKREEQNQCPLKQEF